MNPTTATHRAPTLSLTLAALLACQWLVTGSLAPVDGAGTEFAARVGTSRLSRPHGPVPPDSPARAVAPIVVADDDSEGPPEVPSALAHAPSRFDIGMGYATRGLGTIRDRGTPLPPSAPPRLRC
jgi:hypothetical protein